MFLQAMPKDDKVVIVSNFVSILDAVEDVVNCRGFGPCIRLDGTILVDNRQVLVDCFNNPLDNRRVFLLSSKAGGVGLNL